MSFSKLRLRFFIKKQLTLFCVFVTLCCGAYAGTTHAASVDFLSNQNSHTPTSQALQEADATDGRWSSVSNLISGSGFSQSTSSEEGQKSNDQNQKPTPQRHNNKKPFSVDIVTQPQFLQLQQLVIQLNKTVTQLQQQINNNVSDLKQQNFKLSNRVQNLEMIARLLNIEIQSIKKAQAPYQKKLHSNNTIQDNWYQKIYLALANYKLTTWITLGILLIVFVLILYFIMTRFFFKEKSRLPENAKVNKKSSEPMTAEEEEEGEYDYMNTKDAIPAKFDLANAYIQMGNTKEAEQVLHDIIKIGNEQDKDRAKHLLQNIHQPQ